MSQVWTSSEQPSVGETACGHSLTAESRQVWDLPVRICHWLMVAAFVASYVTNRLGVAYFKYHVWSGCALIVLVSFRILWGLVGTRHARFLNFVRGPVGTVHYVIGLLRGEKEHYVGHNPLGGWMVVALLLALFAQASSGLVSNDEIFNQGPLYELVSPERSLQLTSLHRELFYWISVAALLHVLAVLAHLFFKKQNLVAAMITGKKPREAVPAGDVIHASRTWLAFLIVIVLVVALAWILKYAPRVADASMFGAS